VGVVYVLGVAVRSVRHGRQCREVVEPVQAGLVRDGVDAAEQQVDVVGLARPQARRQLAPDEVRQGRRREVRLVPHRVQLRVGLDVLCELDYFGEGRAIGQLLGRRLQPRETTTVGRERDVLVSPASPEKASSVCLLSDLVLSSEAFRMVAPRIAALDAAIKVKSLPVIPSKTSLKTDGLVEKPV